MNEAPQILIAPLFVEAAGFTSTISIVSELSFAVTAQVVLFDHNGAQVASETVGLPGHSRVAVGIGDLLRRANSAETMGSVEVLPDPAKVVSMAVAAQLSITGSGGSIGQAIEEEFLMSGMAGSGVLRSGGASLVGSPFVAVKNTSASPQTATVSCFTESNAASQQVQLAAEGSALLQACAGSSGNPVSIIGDALVPPTQEAANRGAFGLSVTGSGKAGTLSVFGLAWRGATTGSILSSQNFADVGTLHSGNTVFTGVPIGVANYLPGATFTPQLAMTNFGTKAVNASVLFARTTDSGPESTNVATVSIPAMSSRTIALPPLIGDSGLRNSFIVTSDAAPGGLFASLAAVGAPGFALADQIGKDQDTNFNGGGHPWDLTSGKDAVLLLFNHSTVAKYFNVKIGNGKVLWQQAWQLASMETRAINIRDLIAGQVKDLDGAVLPLALDEGEIGWFTPNPGEGSGRLMQIDPATQTIAGITRSTRNFSCSYPYVICGAYLAIETLTTTEGGNSSPNYLGIVIPMICNDNENGSCSGQSSSQNARGYSYSWLSNSPSIATVYGSSTSSTAMFYGNGAGTSVVSGKVSSANCSGTGSGTVNVTPSITGISPAQGLVGDTTTVTITGSGFGSSPTVNAGDISMSVVSATGTQIVVKFMIPTSDTGGAQNVTVAANGQTSGPQTFYKQIPSNSSVKSAKALNPYPMLCAQSFWFGVAADIVYTVLDQRSQPILSSNMIPIEQDLNQVINGVNYGNQSNWVNVMGGTSLITAGRTYTYSDGTFEDAPIGLCAQIPITASFTQPLAVTVGSGTQVFPIRTNHWTLASSIPISGSMQNASGDVNVHYP